MSLRVFVPRDAAAIACGADAVAAALTDAARAAGVEVALTRNGSRGMLWLEPLVEVAAGDGTRFGFGPVAAADVAGLVAAGMLTDPARVAHPKAIGAVERHPFLARQTRLTFARCGLDDPLSLEAYAATGGWRGLARAVPMSLDDPLSLEAYAATGGWRGLARAVAMSPAEIVAEVTASGLRGRGGAGFPTGIKWKTALEAPGARKYVVCNADEGDSGTFADRMIMEGDPYLLIEGMAIAGLATGASRGFIYLRSEYPHAAEVLGEAIGRSRAAGYLGPRVMDGPAGFELEVRIGAGAYVCGEETSLLDSLEGKRGLVRAKPPLPAHKGLFGMPTVINNVLSLTAVPHILADGAQVYADLGMGRSRGTMPWQIAGNVRHGGLFEAAFGMTLGELVEGIGGGTASGRPIRAVQVGGPLGAYFPPSLFDTPLDYEAFAAADGLIGHGGVVVFDDTVDMAAMARFAFEFCAIESCGKCTPCRLGAVRGRETVERIMAGHDVEANIALIADLSETMKFGSLCALGGFTPYPVMSALRHFPDDFRRRRAPRVAAE